MYKFENSLRQNGRRPRWLYLKKLKKIIYWL